MAAPPPLANTVCPQSPLTGPQTLTIRAAIQLAKLSGFSPIITTASKHNEAYLKSLGATHVIDRSAPLDQLPAAVEAITNKPVKTAYDAIAKPDIQNVVYDILAPGGGVVFVLEVAVDKSKITADKKIVHVIGNVHVPEHRELGKSLYSKLTGLLEADEIKVRLFEGALRCLY